MRSPSWKMLTDAQRSDYIRAAFSDARKQGRGEMMAGHPEIVAGVVPKGMPALPRNYNAGSSAPVALKGLRGSGALPLPPGYALGVGDDHADNRGRYNRRRYSAGYAANHRGFGCLPPLQ